MNVETRFLFVFLARWYFQYRQFKSLPALPLVHYQVSRIRNGLYYSCAYKKFRPRPNYI